MYEIQTISSMEEMGRGNKAVIDVYNWGGDYRPYAWGKLCYIRDQGFGVELYAQEKNPLAVHTGPNPAVCQDSCLEFFAAFDSSRPQLYLNCEANANGALLCCWGTNVHPRPTVIELGAEHPKADVFFTEEGWGYRLFLPLSLFKQVCGVDHFSAGDTIRGSFYKCGDKTAHPHFGSYTNISFERPNFHLPDTFADMVIVD